MITNEIYPFLKAYALIIGLVVGSFLNVVIYRIPNNKSIVKPRSNVLAAKIKLLGMITFRSLAISSS